MTTAVLLGLVAPCLDETGATAVSTVAMTHEAFSKHFTNDIILSYRAGAQAD